MTDDSLLVTEAENSDLGSSSPETDENEDLEEGTEKQDEISDEPADDEVTEPQEPVKDYKQKFNSAMSNLRKLERENEMLKANKTGNKISDDDLAALKDKYDEDDLSVIEKIINKKLDEHESNKLAQREANIFLKDHPEVSTAQMKHLRFMQSEFWYSLKYAYDITFWGKQPKIAPKSHSIWWGQGSKPESKQKEVSDEDAYKDMKANYWG